MSHYPESICFECKNCKGANQESSFIGFCKEKFLYVGTYKSNPIGMSMNRNAIIVTECNKYEDNGIYEGE